jgi:hypothetical protein
MCLYDTLDATTYVCQLTTLYGMCIYLHIKPMQASARNCIGPHEEKKVEASASANKDSIFCWCWWVVWVSLALETSELFRTDAIWLDWIACQHVLQNAELMLFRRLQLQNPSLSLTVIRSWEHTCKPVFYEIEPNLFVSLRCNKFP